MQGLGIREKKNIINHKLLLYISNQIFTQIYISQSIHCTADRTHRIDSLSADRSTFLRLVPSRIHGGLTLLIKQLVGLHIEDWGYKLKYLLLLTCLCMYVSTHNLRYKVANNPYHNYTKPWSEISFCWLLDNSVTFFFVKILYTDTRKRSLTIVFTGKPANMGLLVEWA